VSDFFIIVDFVVKAEVFFSGPVHYFPESDLFLELFLPADGVSFFFLVWSFLPEMYAVQL
jgi:hypothetical protein